MKSANDHIGIIYHHSPDNRARYTLGEKGERMLLGIGVNPSQATPERYDSTIAKTKGFALRNGFEGWVMINLYAQRSTDPKGLHKRRRKDWVQENVRMVEMILENYPISGVLAAWGNLIDSRTWFKSALGELLEIPGLKSLPWFQLGEPTAAGHPRHPCRLGYKTCFQDFSLAEYLQEH